MEYSPLTTHHSQLITNHLSRRWLLMGVFALAIAGLYSLTLVIGRAPVFSNWPEIQRIFKDALVVHVNLSVLFWFLSVAGLLWSLHSRNVRGPIPYVEEAAQICFLLSMLLMMASPFDPSAQAMMSNYIPTISSPLFFLSLGLLLSAVLLMIFRQMTVTAGAHFVCHTGAIIALVAICAFFWSYALMPQVIEGEQYFDLLFWGGGHILQLLHAHWLIWVWWLLAACWIKPQGERWVRRLLWANLFLASVAPVAYLLYPVESSEFRWFFTHIIMTLGGLLPGIMALCLVGLLWRMRAERRGTERIFWSCLASSTALFIYGGVLGLLIQGQNVVIPAHYHGSIVAITLAFMGFTYDMLPRLGWGDVRGLKLAYWQPMIYALGQVMHVSGLAYSGGYGVLRKTSGGVDGLAINIKIALGVMGMGGVLAIIGGLLFVWVCYGAIAGTSRSR